MLKLGCIYQGAFLIVSLGKKKKNSRKHWGKGEFFQVTEAHKKIPKPGHFQNSPNQNLAPSSRPPSPPTFPSPAFLLLLSPKTISLFPPTTTPIPGHKSAPSKLEAPKKVPHAFPPHPLPVDPPFRTTPHFPLLAHSPQRRTLPPRQLLPCTRSPGWSSRCGHGNSRSTGCCRTGRCGSAWKSWTPLGIWRASFLAGALTNAFCPAVEPR